jgi:hypothetical protein
MRILMLSKALVVGAYQKKAEELARLPGVELTVAVPPLWREPGVGPQALERRFTQGYALEVLPIRFNGRHHVHYYPALERLVARLRPDVFHIDEESFNLATFLAMHAGLRHKVQRVEPMEEAHRRQEELHLGWCHGIATSLVLVEHIGRAQLDRSASRVVIQTAQEYLFVVTAASYDALLAASPAGPPPRWLYSDKRLHYYAAW